MFSSTQSMCARALGVCGAGAMILAAGSEASAELYRSQMSSGAGWGINSTSADYAATFGYDYSADGIPEAPNSQGGDLATRGLKLEANIVDPMEASVVSLYPIGQSFSGHYRLRFDAWCNYDADERINGGSAGTTEFLGGGIGYDNASADIGPGYQLIATNDGGSGSDWRAFQGGTFLDPDEMIAADRNGFNAYYSDFLPGVAPPAGQAQLDFPPGTAGSPGFQWLTFEFEVYDTAVRVSVEKPDLSRLDIVWIPRDATSTDGNIMIYYADLFSSVTSRPDLTFGVVDNVVVDVPAPSMAALLGVSAAPLALRRRRR